MPTNSQPLAGTRILAIEQYGAGPFGTQYLADLGAEVIKIETPGTEGDYARSLGPYFVGGDKADTSSSLFFQSFNRNKKSITLDLKHEKGREILGRLVKSADATANNLRGDVPEKLGLTYEHLKVFNPSIVCGHCSGYGRTGPRKDWPGYDYLMQAEAGYFGLCGEPDAPPARFGLSIVDYMGGLSMALGLVSAIMDARTSGKGRDVDVNLFDVAMFNLNYLGAWALNSDYEPQRASRSAHPTLVPCQLYKTSDGWVYIMCNKQVFWPKLCKLVGREELAEDPRFIGFQERDQNRDELTGILDKIFSQKSSASWLEELGGKIPIAPVLQPREALENPFVEGRGQVQTLKHDSGSSLRVLAMPIDVGSARENDRDAPALGEDTAEILGELGYSPEELHDLHKQMIL